MTERELRPSEESPQAVDLLTLEEIIAKYPPQERIYHVNYHGDPNNPTVVSAQVSLDQEGKTCYIVPGSAKFIKYPPKSSTSNT